MHPLVKRIFIHPPVVPIILVSFFINGFWSIANLKNLAMQASLNGILVTALMVVMIAGGFDLSLGVTMAVAGVTTVSLVPYGTPVALLGGVLAGSIIGLANGFLVAKMRVNPFIATFAVMVMARGFILFITDTRPVVNIDPVFRSLARGDILGIPNPALIMIAVMIIVHTLLTQRAWGRHVYAVGRDKQAAKLAGVPVNKILIQTYILCAVLAALAGSILASRLSTGSPIVGETTALMVAAIALLGGATLRGGEGSIPGALAGLVFVAVLVNIMNLLTIPSYYQRITIGALLVFLVTFEGFVHRQKQE